MNNIADLAVSYWRLVAWVDQVNVERKTAATSSLRHIKRFLDENGIEFRDYYGQKYDPGFAIDVIGILSGEGRPEEQLVVAETLVPLVLQNGEVLKYGQVMLGETPKEAVENKALPPDPGKALPVLISNINQYCRSEYKDKRIADKLRWCRSKLFKQLRAIQKDGPEK